MRPSRAKRVGWIALLVLVVIGGIALYLNKLWTPPEATYRTSLIERRTIAHIVEATGQLDVEQRFEVPAPTGGVVAEILVKQGDSVTLDQVLGTLDTATADQATREAEAAARAAASRVALARTELEGVRTRREHLVELYEDQFAKRLDVEAARAAERRAAAALKQAEAEQRLAKEKLESATKAEQRLSLRSPTDGIVLQGPLWVGTVVSPDRGALFVIGKSLTRMRVDVSVAEADIGTIQAGQRAEFTVPAFPGRTFQATVERVGVDSEKRGAIRVYPVILRGENPDQVLRPGMSANVRILVARVEGALAVREAALRFVPRGSNVPSRAQVWVSRDGVDLERFPVTAGLSDGAYTEIRPVSGKLAPGDPVVIGVLNPERVSDNGPGISLGAK